MGKRELVALLNLSSWCLVMIERLFLAVPQGCLQFVTVVFPDHTHLLLLLGGQIFLFLFPNMVVWHIKLKGMVSRMGYKLSVHPMIKLVTLRYSQ